MSTDPQSGNGVFRIGAPLVAVFSVLAGPLLGDTAVAQEAQIEAAGHFTNGRGPCGFPPEFQDRFLVLFNDTEITIEQPSTGDSVSGTIDSDGKLRLRSKKESYRGTARGKDIRARYAYTSDGCTTVYDAALQLAQPAPLPEPPAAVETAEPEPDPTEEPAPEEQGSDEVAVTGGSQDQDSDGGAIWPWFLAGVILLAGTTAALQIKKGQKPAPAGSSSEAQAVATASTAGGPPDVDYSSLAGVLWKCSRCNSGVRPAVDVLRDPEHLCPTCQLFMFDPQVVPEGKYTAGYMEELFEPTPPVGGSEAPPSTASGDSGRTGSHPKTPPEPVEDIMGDLPEGPTVIS
jgi:hypothetical protein